MHRLRCSGIFEILLADILPLLFEICKYHDKQIIISEPRISFSAYSEHPSGALYGDLKRIIYNETRANEGSAYDPKTGIFTTPFNGTYFFAFNSVTASGNYCRVHLYKNGYTVAYATAEGRGSDGEISASNSGVWYLTEGDRMFLGTANCDILPLGPRTFFTGFKI